MNYIQPRLGSVCVGMLLIQLFCFSNAQYSAAQGVRKALWAGNFYPASSHDLSFSIAKLTEQASKTKIEIPINKELKALILPHAGYVYSGFTAAHAARLLTSSERYHKVILMGPDHRGGFMYGAVSDAAFFQTPLAETALHDDSGTLRNNRYFRAIDASDKSEHSLEVVLPFLQSYLNQFTLVPIVMGLGDTDGMTDAIDSIIDANTLLVVSSDLSHYLSYDEAVKRDAATIEMIIGLESEKILEDENRACGIKPIVIALDIARRRKWQPVLLNYTNSGDTAGGKDRVVGYAAIAFYEEIGMAKKKESKEISHEQGQVLCDLARNSILQRFGRGKSGLALQTLNEALQDEIFAQKGGVFVTLHLNGKLRGCIGSLVSNEPIRNGVRSNAENAAFSDYRFQSLTEGEAEKVDLEVSILSEPQALEYADGAELISKLRPGVDGVILSKGAARATFLPQVWEQLSNPEDFLSHLCRKAGLGADAWRQGDLTIQTYQVTLFEEEK